MRKITELRPSENFILHIRFDNGTEKTFDLKPYLHLPAFAALQKQEAFQNVINKGYFIEWPTFEVDLSADTLWHEGKSADSKKAN
ncbi:MAG TPA: DUF2442 domain-containing protein [Bacteroidia bacterium]|nr:DUF2442 domain-containing protein [Bacteroidia bacterium]